MTFVAAEQIKDCQMIFLCENEKFVQAIFEKKNAKYSLINVFTRKIYFKRLSQ